MTNYELKNEWNTYCEKECRSDKVYDMDDFENVTAEELTDSEIANANSDDFSRADSFFKFEKVGTEIVLTSADWVDELIDEDALNEWRCS